MAGHCAKPFASKALHYMPPPDIKPYPAAERNTGPRPVAGSVQRPPSLSTASSKIHSCTCGWAIGNEACCSISVKGAGCRRALPAHQVIDVFVSHAHFDHISGFLWLLRSCIGDFPPCRVFGPPGLTDHIAGLIQGILWDRIGELGPRFEVCELHGERLHIFALQAGRRGKSRDRATAGTGWCSSQRSHL
ncbi:MAG: hypothetical protein GQ559_11895 [Desulfobulbaceae bacterium]|nr:hypothetical protein [Desulfobulbaceae bacterium]